MLPHGNYYCNREELTIKKHYKGQSETSDVMSSAPRAKNTHTHTHIHVHTRRKHITCVPHFNFFFFTPFPFANLVFPRLCQFYFHCWEETHFYTCPRDTLSYQVPQSHFCFIISCFLRDSICLLYSYTKARSDFFFLE